MSEEIPPYIYATDASPSLLQGDILKVDGKFRENFNKYYPAIKHNEGEDKYVLILTQSCDLVKSDSRQPKLQHVNVCLVRPFEAVIANIIENEAQPEIIGGSKILLKDAMDKLKDQLLKLLNNNDQKIHFFLPKKAPLTQDMIALLHMSFSFRMEQHYEELLANRILSLKPEFQAKLGHVLSELYGRIATSDLLEYGWDDKSSKRYINKLLKKANITQVPDQSFIQYIQEEHLREPDIKKLIQECQAIKLEKKFESVKKRLLQETRHKILKIFKDPLEVKRLQALSANERSTEIKRLIE